MLGRTTTNLFPFSDLDISNIQITNSGIGFTYVNQAGDFVMNIDGSTRTVTVQNFVVLGSGSVSYSSFAVDPGLPGYTYSLGGAGSNMWFNTVDSSISFRINYSLSTIFKIQTGGVTATRYFAEPGLVSAPAYTFTTDNSTGLYLSAANSLAVTTNNINRLTIANAGITATVKYLNISGVPSSPAYAFSSTANSGMYYSDASQYIGFSIGGSARAYISATQTYSANPFVSADGGLVTAPAFTFASAVDSGMYFPAPQSIGFATSGAARLTISATAVSATVPFYAPTGSLSGPAYSFFADTNTGIYNPSADTLVLVNNGIQSLKTDSKNNVIAGNETVLTGSSDAGFLYIPTANSAPTTTPVVLYSGKTPIVYDSTNHLFNLYDSKWLQIKPGYWHLEANSAIPWMIYSAGVTGFSGNSYYNMSLDGDLLNVYMRTTWTAKGTGTGQLIVVVPLGSTFPYTFPGSSPYATTIPVTLGYKEGIAFATQIMAAASIETFAGDPAMFVRFYLYSQTATNPPDVVNNTTTIATDGKLSFTISYPLNTIQDSNPITGF